MIAKRLNLIAYRLVAVQLVIASGCGTMISGRRQDVTLNVQPSDATVSIYRWNGELLAGPELASTGTVNVHRPVDGEPYLVLATGPGSCPRYWVTDHEPSPGAYWT